MSHMTEALLKSYISIFIILNLSLAIWTIIYVLYKTLSKKKKRNKLKGVLNTVKKTWGYCNAASLFTMIAVVIIVLIMNLILNFVDKLF